MITNKDYIISILQLNINYAHLQILETVPQPGHKLQSPHWGGIRLKFFQFYKHMLDTQFQRWSYRKHR